MARRFWLSAAAVVLIGAVAVRPAAAAVIPIGVGMFGAGSTLTTFNGLADGTDVNGLVVNGIAYQYSLGNGMVVIDGGPGTTGNVAPPNVVSVGNNTGVLTLRSPRSPKRSATALPFSRQRQWRRRRRYRCSTVRHRLARCRSPARPIRHSPAVLPAFKARCPSTACR